MSDTVLPAASMSFSAVTREIRGDTIYFADMFNRMAAFYPECRITAEPNGGVAIRFEGSWKDRFIRPGDDVLPKLIAEDKARRPGWFARLFR